jgi:type VI secretion system protein ImpC
LFKKLYEAEFGTPGGEPYGLLIGDYEFSNNPDDLEFLDNVSHVAAAAFCPFLSAAGPSLLGIDKWTDLSKPKDLEKVLEAPEYQRWRGLRDSEDSRFVSLVMPRVLARTTYGSKTKPVDEFKFEETEFDAKGNPKALEHEQYCWMNAAYVMGVRMTASFSDYGWCTAVRGAEGGGKVEGLPTQLFISDDGDIDAKCPTEIGITDRRESELTKLGLLPLCHYKNTDYAVFFGGQTIQRPKVFESPEATANAAVAARLPFIMATSRFAHYLKIMARDKIGSFKTATELQSWLNRWISTYVNTNPDVGPTLKAKYPLAEAKVEVKEVPGRPGVYNAVAWLKPWMQLEELTTSLRLVARVPELK